MAKLTARDAAKGNEMYEGLDVYFPPKLLLEDLASRFTREDLISFAEPKHRVAMTLFADEFIPPPPLVSRLPAPPIPSQHATEAANTMGLEAKTVLVNVRGQVLSSRFPFVSDPKLIPIKDLEHYITSSLKLPLNVITHIDCSQNNLLDEDLPIIQNFVTSLPRVVHVDLAYNRFHGWSPDVRKSVDSALTAMLNKKSIKWINVSANPLASIDRKDFFEGLNNTQLSKLIFIPQSWIDGKGWHVMVRPNMLDIVHSAHAKSYAGAH